MKQKTSTPNDGMAWEDFTRMSQLIQNQFGIKMPQSKKIMLESRLRKRLRVLNMDSFGEYCDLLFSSKGLEVELIHLIDAVSTNKTDFFREAYHFDYLTDRILPRMGSGSSSGFSRKCRAWSAGCSTGEEPYTLAIVLSEFAKSYPGFDFSILATDVSKTVLSQAISGVYSHEQIEPIPMLLRKKYLLKSKVKERSLVKIASELRNRVEFRWLNFMDQDFGIKQSFDIIFCRNVLIYFDRPTQERLLLKLCNLLTAEGHIFLGHSESVHGLDLPLTRIENTIYRKIPQ
ncbi:MAG: chemotaxis protein CheR [Deferribacteres bacterium]|nr:chemotaxis protein CheR [Deferribacteres bacterium]